MQQPGWISRELCWVEKKNHKRLHTLWLHIYCILEMTNYRNGGQISGCQGLRRGWGQRGSECGNTGATEEQKWSVSLLMFWLWYYCTIALQDITIGENGIKGTRDLSIVFYKGMWIYDYLQIKSVKTCRLQSFWFSKSRVTADNLHFKKFSQYWWSGLPFENDYPRCLLC